MSSWVENCLEIVPGTLSDYKKLARYHYLPEPIYPISQIYKVRAKAPHTEAFPDPIAINIYRQPLPNLAIRNKATYQYFLKPATRKERLKLVNAKIQYGCRLIVDPRFQKMGIGTMLVKDCLERQTVPIVEALMPISFPIKMLQKLGYKLHHNPAPQWYNKLIYEFYRIGLTPQSLLSPIAVHNRLDHLTPEKFAITNHRIKQFLTHFRHREKLQHGFARTRYVLSKIPYPSAYLIWFNPRVPKYNE